MMPTLPGRTWPYAIVAMLLIGCALLDVGGLNAAADTDREDEAVAASLAAMLRAGRTIISRNQDRINDPNLANKGLTGEVVLNQTVELYKNATGADPATIDPASRHGRLLRAQMDAIREVMDANQTTINQFGVSFKGLIPATFARLVNEAFGRRAANDAEIKVTAPLDLVRNRKARPDEWELEVIRERLDAGPWTTGQLYATLAQSKGRPAFRVAVPEYYAASCLSCHGGPKGQIDITGYPKEGAKEGDLGGVISITLYR